MKPSVLILVKRMIIAVFRMVAFIAAIVIIIVYTQDYLVFPGLLAATPIVPKNVEALTVITKDKEHISVWRVAAKENQRKPVVLLFHGNGQNVETFEGIQKWFSALGFNNYSVEYRGFGASSGFPSEKGIYLDGEASIEFLIEKEHISPHEIIVFGFSIGTGPAAYIASKYKVGTLVLIAPQVSSLCANLTIDATGSYGNGGRLYTAG